MKVGRLLVVWDVNFLLWSVKILCQARRDENPVGMIIRADQSFDEEFHGIDACWILWAVKKMVLVLVICMAAWTDGYRGVLYFGPTVLVDSEGLFVMNKLYMSRMV